MNGLGRDYIRRENMLVFVCGLVRNLILASWAANSPDPNLETSPDQGRTS